VPDGAGQVFITRCRRLVRRQRLGESRRWQIVWLFLLGGFCFDGRLRGIFRRFLDGLVPMILPVRRSLALPLRGGVIT